jgi:hypothetical protein
MDRLGGLHGSFDASDEDDLGIDGDALGAEAPPSPVGQDERRMQVRAYNHWSGLLGANHFPSIDDLEPEGLDDFGPHSVLLEFENGIDDPRIRFLGDKLAEECGADAQMMVLSDVPSLSLLSRITDHYMQILANQAPIGFEAEFVNQRDLTVLYRGILLPFSSDGQTIDFIYGVINWKELADQELTDSLLSEIGDVLAEDEADEPVEEDVLELADELSSDGAADMSDILELSAGMEEYAGLDNESPELIGAALQPDEDDILDLATLADDSPDPVELPIPAVEPAADTASALDGADEDWGLGDWDEEPEGEDVDDVIDPLADESAHTGLTGLVSRGISKPRKSFALSTTLSPQESEDPQDSDEEGADDPLENANLAEDNAQPLDLGAFEADSPDPDKQTPDTQTPDTQSPDTQTPYGQGAQDVADDDRFGSFAPLEIGADTGPELVEPDAWYSDTDEQPEIGPETGPETGEHSDQAEQTAETVSAPDEMAETPETAEEGLYDCLAAAREAAEHARSSEDRSRTALYDAVGRAYDFSLAAQDDPQEFAELISENALTLQKRAPMTPVVKLVFGANYDKTRLTEYAAVLSHAHRQNIARGELSAFLSQAEGGLKGVVQAERRARKQAAGKSVDAKPAVNKTLAKKLRKLEGCGLDKLDGDGAEFALVMVRRQPDGQAEILGEVPEDIALVERAARKLLG